MTPEPIPAGYRNWNEVPWFPQPNDLIGGWCIMTVDKPPSECNMMKGEIEVACFMNEETARRIASLHNAQLLSSSQGWPVGRWTSENLPLRLVGRLEDGYGENAEHMRAMLADVLNEYDADRLAAWNIRQRRTAPMGHHQQTARAWVMKSRPFSAVLRLRDDLAHGTCDPVSPHGADLVQVLDLFDQMHAELYRDLERADIAAADDSDIVDAAPCPTRCDPDCDALCHEQHEVSYKQRHQPEDHERLAAEAGEVEDEPNERTRAAARRLQDVVHLKPMTDGCADG